MRVDFTEEPKKVKSLGARLLNFLLAVLTVTLLFVVCISLIFEVCQVDGMSMLPTLKNESFILCKSGKELSRGDIVIVSVPGKRLVKRIVAVPGDEIVFAYTDDPAETTDGFKNIKLYLKKQGDNRFYKVDEDYILDGIMTQRCFSGVPLYGCEAFYSELFEEDIASLGREYIITLNESEYYVLGDNRDKSLDSRFYGKIAGNKIVGKYIYEIDGGPLYYLLDALHSVSLFITKNVAN